MGRSLSSIRNQINEFRLQKIKNKYNISESNSTITNVNVPSTVTKPETNVYKRFSLLDPSNPKPNKNHFNLFREISNGKKGRRNAHITPVKTIFSDKNDIKTNIPLLLRQSQVLVGTEIHIKDAYNNLSNVKDINFNNGLLRNRRIKWNISNNTLHIVWEDWRKPINLFHIDNIMKSSIQLSYDPSLLFNIVLKDESIPFLGVIMYNSKCVFKNNTEKVDYYFLKL